MNKPKPRHQAASLSLYVEFVGPAGYGKTTLGKLLLKELNKKGYNCIFRSPLFPQEQKIRAFFKKVIFGIRLIKYLNLDILPLFFNRIKDKYYIPGVTRRVINNAIQRRLIDYMIVKYITTRQGYDFLINDEGLTKIIGLAVMTNLDQEKMFHIVEKIIPPRSILIFLEVDDDIAIEREERRGLALPFLSELDNSRKKELYQERKIIRNALYKKLRGKTGIKVVRIESTESIDSVSKQVNQFVTEAIEHFI